MISTARAVQTFIRIAAASVVLFGCSDGKTIFDQVPPDAVVLSFAPLDDGSIELRWVAPGDDGAKGTAAAYDLRYVHGAMPPDSFPSAIPVDSLPRPQQAGAEERFVLRGLVRGEPYAVVLKTRDDAGNWSALSNILDTRAADEGSDANWSENLQAPDFRGVWCLGEHQGSLYVGQAFSSLTSVSGVVRWTGSGFEAIARGDSVSDPDGGIECLASYRGKLIAGGSFRAIDGVPAANIAAWNGEGWEPLGRGLEASHPGLTVYALVVFEGNLIAAGAFDHSGATELGHIAQWDGTSWSPLGAGISGSPNRLLATGQDLIAAGSFTEAGGGPCLNIAAWNGSSWRTLGSGLPGNLTDVTALNGDLVACGDELYINGVASRFARWDGAVWRAMTVSGIHGTISECLVVYNGRLVCGAATPAPADGPGYEHDCIARWNGTSWRPLGSGIVTSSSCYFCQPPGVWRMAVCGRSLYVAGDFRKAGGKRTYGFACWTDEAESTLAP